MYFSGRALASTHPSLLGFEASAVKSKKKKKRNEKHTSISLKQLHLAAGCHNLVQSSNQLAMNAPVMSIAIAIRALSISMRRNLGLNVLVANQASVGRKCLVRRQNRHAIIERHIFNKKIIHPAEVET